MYFIRIAYILRINDQIVNFTKAVVTFTLLTLE